MKKLRLRRKRTSYMAPRTYVSELLVWYFNRVKFPKYKFNIDTYYTSLFNSLVVRGTHFNIHFVEMMNFSSNKEYLNKFVPRNEYVSNFFYSFVKNPQYFHIIPNLRHDASANLIKQREVEKKKMHSFIEDDKFSFLNRKKQDKKSSFCLIEEFNDGESLTETDEDLEKKEEIHKNYDFPFSPRKKYDSIEKVECLALYLEKKVLDREKLFKSKEVKPNVNQDQNSLFNDSQSEIALSKIIRDSVRRSSRRSRKFSTMQKILKLQEDSVSKKEEDKRKSSSVLSYVENSVNSPKFYKPKRSSAFKEKYRKSCFHFEIPSFGEKTRFAPTIEFLFKKKEQKRKQKLEKKKLIEGIKSLSTEMSSFRKAGTQREQNESVKNRYITKKKKEVPFNMMTNFQRFGKLLNKKIPFSPGKDTYSQTNFTKNMSSLRANSQFSDDLLSITSYRENEKRIISKKSMLKSKIINSALKKKPYYLSITQKNRTLYQDSLLSLRLCRTSKKVKSQKISWR